MERFQPAEDLPLEAVSGWLPQKCVKRQQDMDKWLRSEAYYNILGFINGISTAIQGIRMTNPDIYVSDTIEKLIGIFDKLNNLVDETPPIEQPQRFGNKAYRAWSRKMNHDIFMLLKDAIPQEKCELLNELGYYLAESFGNSIRIDYGTGHELSFLFFLCALFKGKILTEDDNVACALKLFNTYLLFVRRLQKTYRMEPAGSQGVWSLDDFQFVPFIWGSAQLAYKSPFDPSKFLEENIRNEYKDDYMFIGCIDYISQVKTGHFAEHSNQLWSITAVPSWTKINSGLVKMYQKEIMAKYPVIQHVLFGKLMSFNSVTPGTTIPNARLGFVPGVKEAHSSSSHLSEEAMPPPSSKTSSYESSSSKSQKQSEDKKDDEGSEENKEHKTSVDLKEKV